ncbi:MAG TPA: hypothetical protein VKE27_08440 [Candidatus Dormibacteraeota bacterium]|nr:hypothetical protein [Candidatus Dormibacteraeota bacterium]
MSLSPSPEPAPLAVGSKPQWSPAGDYYWDGAKWVLYVPQPTRAPQASVAPPPSLQQAAFQPNPWIPPPTTQVTVSAGTAFKIGFFGIMGAWAASLIPAVIIWILVAVVFASCIASLSRSGG